MGSGLLENGVEVQLKLLPCRVRLFKLVAQNGDIDWILKLRSLKELERINLRQLQTTRNEFTT